MIDAHHHFWTYVEAEFDWISDGMAILRQNFLPEDLETVTGKAGVTGVVTVQARQTLEETNWLLTLAAKNSLIKGVVGWVPLKDPQIGNILDQVAANPRLRGVREVLQGMPDEQFLTSAEFNRGIEALTLRAIPYDLLIFHHQLASATRFVDRHPNQRFILDHIAKPAIGTIWASDWAREIHELAKRPNVFCKFSGVITEVSDGPWSVERIRPYFETVVEAFSPSRLMFGSDWPVCLLGSDYVRWVATVKELARSLPAGDQQAIFTGAACTAYAL